MNEVDEETCHGTAEHQCVESRNIRGVRGRRKTADGRVERGGPAVRREKQRRLTFPGRTGSSS
jgi:hypothetical protein